MWRPIVFYCYLLNFLEPEQFSLRLLGGAQSNEGRLQVYYTGQWGGVCGGGWGYNEGAVACKQLGYGGITLTVAGDTYGAAPHEEPLYLNNIQCSGDEPGLRYCTSDKVGVAYCPRTNMAGVVCPGMLYIMCPCTSPCTIL